MGRIILFAIITLALLAAPVAAAQYTPEQCIEFSTSYLLEKDFVNALAWADYGLRDYPGNLKLEALRFKVSQSNYDKNDDAAARDRLKTILTARANEMTDEVIELLIGAGYFRPQVRLALPQNGRGEEYVPDNLSLELMAVGLNRVSPRLPEGAPVNVLLPVTWQAAVWIKNNSDYTARSIKVSVGIIGNIPVSDPYTGDDPGALPASDQPSASPKGSQPAGRNGMPLPVRPPATVDPGIGIQMPAPTPAPILQPGGPEGGREYSVPPGEVKKLVLEMPLDIKGDKFTQALSCALTWINDKNDRTNPVLTVDRVETDFIPIVSREAPEKP